MEIHLKAEAIFRKTDNGNPHWWTEDFVGNIRQFEEWQITVSKKVHYQGYWISMVLLFDQGEIVGCKNDDPRYWKNRLYNRV